MKTGKRLDGSFCCLLWLGMLILLFHPSQTSAALEQTFKVLQIGTATYRNVTITTKNKNYIFILHSTGMTNIRVDELPSDLRTQLGYADPAAPVVNTNSPAAWVRQTLAKAEVSQVRQLREGLAGWWRSEDLQARLGLAPLTQSNLLVAAAALLALYLFHSYCCLLICEKACSKPGPLVWLPLLKLFPLLRAAAMSRWWVLGFLIPGLNLVALLVWFIKITRARGKSLWVAVFLTLPLTSPFAALYLAFSGGRRAAKPSRRIEIMTLEAA